MINPRIIKTSIIFIIVAAKLCNHRCFKLYYKKHSSHKVQILANYYIFAAFMTNTKRIAVIGAGPAGLTAAYLLSKANQEVVVFEKDPKYVGGISRTESYKGYNFDIGGHRFFSKSKEVEDFWTEILGDDLIDRPRSSRIYYNKKFFSYPLAAMEALTKLGVIESALVCCQLS